VFVVRIAIDAHNLWTAGGRSIGRNVVATLPRLAPMHEYLVILPSGVGYETSYGENVRIVESRASASIAHRAYEGLVEVPAAMRKFSPEVILALGNLPVRQQGAFQALLVHDAHLFYPAGHYAHDLPRDKFRQRIQAGYLRRGLRHVDLVFCQTETAASRFRRVYDFPKVAVMPNAVSVATLANGFKALPPESAIARETRFQLLALTRYYTHKNLELIVEAYESHPDLLEDTVCYLTIDGSHHPKARALLERIAKTVPEQVINLGPLAQEDLGAYWAAVDALVHPSMLESFSSAYLEAMAFGVPILTSDLDFAREVCGPSAVYFDPIKSRSLAKSVARLRDDVALQGALAAEGRARSEQLVVPWDDVVVGALDAMGIAHSREAT
jgi:glycosyltransferase involved in cell wall biosynthesis